MKYDMLSNSDNNFRFTANITFLMGLSYFISNDLKFHFLVVFINVFNWKPHFFTGF